MKAIKEPVSRKVRVQENLVLDCASKFLKKQVPLSDLKLAYARYEEAREKEIQK